MKKIVKKYTAVILAAALVLAAAAPVWGQDTENIQNKPNVLFLSSYTITFETVPLEVQGIQSVLTGEKVNLDMEFMDSRRFSSEKDEEAFYCLLKSKIEQLSPYDAVILGDDAALAFAREYRDRLFPGIPMVFLGVNSRKAAKKAVEDPGITGITEDTSLTENLRLAKKLRPKAEEIVAIVDNTITGIGDQEQAKKAFAEFPQMAHKIINASSLTRAEIEEELEAIAPESIVLFLTMYEDKEGNRYSIPQAARIIAAHVKAPVFRTSVGGVGDGLLGGIMFSYVKSGEMAGEMTERILTGTPVSQIPLVTESPSFGYFDNRILEKYNIDKKLLPQGSKLINEETELFVVDRRTTVIVGTVAAVLVLILILLFYEDMRRKKIMDYDQLTGLHSRNWMTAYIENLIARNEMFGVFMMDFDNFKRINDTLGHMYGDEILRQVASRIESANTGTLKTARFGGDEFLGVIEVYDKYEAETLVSWVQTCFERPFHVEEKEIKVSISMGVAMVPEDGKSAEEVIAKADTAMYVVKNSGKNGYRFFEKEMQASIRRQSEVSGILHEAIENDGFCMVYQPKVFASDGRLYGFEALVRLKNGKAFPDEFIAVAEQEGQIVEIGRIVAQKVIRQMGEWKQKGLPPVKVSINFSNIQIRDYCFPEYLTRLMEDYEIQPENVEIEITETVFLKRTEEAAAYMQELAKSGIHLSMDDFGSGYSAIRYLRFVPIRVLKMDKSLLDEYHESGESKMIAAIIHMAHDLELKVVAEGAETEEEVALLNSLDCDYIQGYYFGCPVPAETAEKYIRKGSCR